MAHKSSAPDTEAFELVPAGTHLAICCAVVYMGWQEGEYKGKKECHPKILFMWEICNEKDKDGKPFTICAFYTDSLHGKANMRKMLETWRSKGFTDSELRGFDVTKVLGKPCMISVIHKEIDRDIKARVQSVSSVPRGTRTPLGVNQQLYYTVEPGDPDSCEKFMLPEWIQKWCDKARPAPGKPDGTAPPDATYEDEIPF